MLTIRCIISGLGIRSRDIKAGCVRDGSGILFCGFFRRKKDRVYSPTLVVTPKNKKASSNFEALYCYAKTSEVATASLIRRNASFSKSSLVA